MRNRRARLVSGLAATLLGVTAPVLSGPAHATASTSYTFVCPAHDDVGKPLLEHSTAAGELLCRYEKTPNDFFCKYRTDNGLLKQDHDAGHCHPTAVPT